MTGFPLKDVIGKNCTVFQPNSLGQWHNTLIKDGIERKLFKELRKESPLILKKKNGFCNRLVMEY